MWIWVWVTEMLFCFTAHDDLLICECFRFQLVHPLDLGQTRAFYIVERDFVAYWSLEQKSQFKFR